MTVSQVEQANRKLKRAQAELDKLLEAGADATGARENLAAAQTELDLAEQAARERELADEQRIEAEAEAEAGAMAEAIAIEIAEAVASIARRLEGLVLPAIPTDRAAKLARGRREAERLAADAAEVRDRLARVETRLSDLVAARQQIIARRMAGDERDTDGASLALIDADREGLGDLATRTRDEMLEAEGRHLAARNALAQAKTRWTAAIEGAWCDAMAALARRGEEVVTDADMLMVVNGNRRKRWEPAHDMANLLHNRNL